MRFNEVGVAVFAYNRSEHLNKTILALKNNTVHPSKLFLFHDGIKNGEDRREWDKVQSIIESVEWCDKEINQISSRKKNNRL